MRINNVATALCWPMMVSNVFKMRCLAKYQASETEAAAASHDTFAGVFLRYANMLSSISSLFNQWRCFSARLMLMKWGDHVMATARCHTISPDGSLKAA